MTSKHKNLINPIVVPNTNIIKLYKCKCGKQYKHASTLCAHKKTCLFFKHKEPTDKEPTDKNDIIMLLLKQNYELIKEHSDIKQIMLEIVKNGINNNNNTTNHNTINSHNKSFNLK